MKSDVLIIGGGAGGLSCGITLASAEAKPWFKDRRIVIVDDNRSDLSKAMLNNAPGVLPGTSGMELLQQLHSQLAQYESASQFEASCLTASRSADGSFQIRLDNDMELHAAKLVLATGYKRFEVEGLPIAPEPHPRGGKTDRIMLQHDGVYGIETDLHVAGLLAGGSSQFAIAAGIGAQVAVEILSEWAGKRTHVHEVPDRT